MLTNDMNLKQMLDFKPTDEDMSKLNLNIIVYIKALFMSKNQEENNETIRFIINNEESKNIFTDLKKSQAFSFKSKDNKYLTITEFYSKIVYQELEDYLKDLLDNYKGNTLYTLNLFTHDNHHYVLDNIEGYINIEKIT